MTTGADPSLDTAAQSIISAYMASLRAPGSVQRRPYLAREHLHVYFTTPSSCARAARKRISTAAERATGSSTTSCSGALDTIVRKLHDHLNAGADHVAIQVIGLEPGRSALPR
jgi:hypothetical protein